MLIIACMVLWAIPPPGNKIYSVAFQWGELTFTHPRPRPHLILLRCQPNERTVNN